jgi:phospholipid/cholesterol/gamma-HCH transport system substrate-binding protein
VKISNEAKVGFIAVVAILAAYFGFNYLKGIDVFNDARTFYAVYPKVDGLSSDNTVQLNGFKIGRVRKIQLMNNASASILVTFEINNDNVFIAEDAKARIASTDLFGSKAIQLVMGTSPVELHPGDTLYSEIEGDLKAEVDKRLRPLEQKTNDLIGSIDSLVTIVQSILDEEAAENLSESFSSINRSFKTFETTLKRVDTLVVTEREKFDEIVNNMNSIIGNVEKNNENISAILTNMNHMTDSLAKSDLVGTIDNAGKAMENVAEVMEKINNGEGTIGMLMNNDTLYTNLESATLQLDLLLEDMRVNPKRYVHFSVFGKKEKQKDKPKKKERPE